MSGAGNAYMFRSGRLRAQSRHFDLSNSPDLARPFGCLGGVRGMNPSSSEVGGSNPEPRILGSTELTPVHQRNSRRLRGEVPEFSPLDSTRRAAAVHGDATQMASKVMPAQVVVDPPMTPEPFHDAVLTVFGNSIEVLCELVRPAVRDKLQGQRLDHRAAAVSSLADVVREEVRLVVRDPQPIREPQHYAQPEKPPERPQRYYAPEHAPATR
ncbi:hypothetical protein HPB52_002520 [Rhipicephalus sanguineus]|uniref:Uncharacterized protein n=1 Tax=Rhipicephalus sanguineus TaxID=34632 RepID=A0A9D4PBF5_RHISA|nr:hypothetical protein HPB52_002520 [Rhipicephalus sanguineus]